VRATAYFVRVSRHCVLNWLNVDMIQQMVQAVMSDIIHRHFLRANTHYSLLHTFNRSVCSVYPSLSKQDCTYSHFEHSSSCPTCRKQLGENDFTELVVADNNGSSTTKSHMQALFSRKSISGVLPYTDLCEGLIQHIEFTKKSTKFLMKQLIVQIHQGRNGSESMQRSHAALAIENTRLKQQSSSLRLQYEQSLNDLQNKLRAKESTIAEQNHVINNFQKIHGARVGGGGSGIGGGPHMVPHSSTASLASRNSEPPLRGLMAQREASLKAQQNAMNGSKPPFMNNLNVMNRSKSPGTNFRPYSASTGSIGGGTIGTAGTRIRDLSASSGYHFTGIANQNMNKRRRGGTPTSLETPTHAMSPTTAFTLNQGFNRRQG
jgi:hypothetical protein